MWCFWVPGRKLKKGSWYRRVVWLIYFTASCINIYLVKKNFWGLIWNMHVLLTVHRHVDRCILFRWKNLRESRWLWRLLILCSLLNIVFRYRLSIFHFMWDIIFPLFNDVILIKFSFLFFIAIWFANIVHINAWPILCFAWKNLYPLILLLMLHGLIGLHLAINVLNFISSDTLSSYEIIDILFGSSHVLVLIKIIAFLLRIIFCLIQVHFELYLFFFFCWAGV